MMAGKKYWVVGVVMMAMGYGRMSFEQALHDRYEREKLLPPALALATKEKIGQTSAGVAMGGLRTLVASFLNLRAFRFFTEKRWEEVEDTYGTIVALAPQTKYYWDSGAWHMAYNASVSNLNQQELPAIRRKELWRMWVMKGKKFYERGIRNNPDEPQLMCGLGYLLIDSNKFLAFKRREEAFEQAADWFGKALATGRARGPVERFRLYALARVPGREREAYELSKRLYEESVQNRTSTLRCVYYVLGTQQGEEGECLERVVRIFGSEERAYQMLSHYWMRPSEYFPMNGVADALASLEVSLKVPEDKRVLLQTVPMRKSLDGWLNEPY